MGPGSRMSYGLKLGCGRPIAECIGSSGEYTLTLAVPGACGTVSGTKGYLYCFLEPEYTLKRYLDSLSLVPEPEPPPGCQPGTHKAISRTAKDIPAALQTAVGMVMAS